MTQLPAGRWVRRETPATRPHTCSPPEQAARGDIWQCDCGRRWKCADHVTRSAGRIAMRAEWGRRYWPWPRLEEYIAPDVHLSELLGVDPTDVDRLLNGPRSSD